MSAQVSVGMIIRYASHNLRFIYSTNTKDIKECPKVLSENHDENVCQPLCIGSWAELASWSPKHTSSESCGITLSPHIRTASHTSSVLKSLKNQSNKITSKGKLNPLQESRGGENIIRSNYNSKARDTSRSYHLKNTREREIKHIATGTYPQPRGRTTPSSSWRAPRWWRWPPERDFPLR